MWTVTKNAQSGTAAYEFLFTELTKTAHAKVNQSRLAEAGEALKHAFNRAEIADTRTFRQQATRRPCTGPSRMERMELNVVPYAAELLTEVAGINFRILAKEEDKVERIYHTKRKEERKCSW